MAYDNNEVKLEDVHHDIGLNPLTLTLAMVAGTGVVLMIVALGVGVIGGEDAGSAPGILFGAGFLAMIVGSVAWYGVVQPHKHFDDINVPLDDGHGHGHGHDEHATEVIVIDSHGNRTVEYAHGHSLTSGAEHEEPGEVNVQEPVAPQTTAPTHPRH
jgi:hypothetical protein